MRGSDHCKVSTVSTANMTREEWLVQRRKSIGGSDASAVIGLNPWSSAYSVWADKTGRLPDKPDNEAMRQGRDLENYVAMRWSEETGKRVRRSNQMYYNSKYPFAHADIDRLVVGESAGLECKTTSTLDIRQFNGVEFPEKYYVQCVHYLAVTGLQRWYLAVLVYGKGFYTYTLERDQSEIDALMAAEGEFWQLVENDTPPAPDGKEATSDALQVLYAESSGGQVELFGRESLLDEYMTLKQQDKSLTERMDEISNIIKADLETAERGVVGNFNVSWKSQSRSTFQPKAFALAHPEIDMAPFYSVTSSRRFEVREKANNI